MSAVMEKRSRAGRRGASRRWVLEIIQGKTTVAEA